MVPLCAISRAASASGSSGVMCSAWSSWASSGPSATSSASSVCTSVASLRAVWNEMSRARRECSATLRSISCNSRGMARTSSGERTLGSFPPYRIGPGVRVMSANIRSRKSLALRRSPREVLRTFRACSTVCRSSACLAASRRASTVRGVSSRTCRCSARCWMPRASSRATAVSAPAVPRKSSRTASSVRCRRTERTVSPAMRSSALTRRPLR